MNNTIFDTDQILCRSKQRGGNQRKGCNSFKITPKGREKGSINPSFCRSFVVLFPCVPCLEIVRAVVKYLQENSCRDIAQIARPRKRKNPQIFVLPAQESEDFGRSGGIRTHGLLDPNQARYQTSPHPVTAQLLYLLTAGLSTVFFYVLMDLLAAPQNPARFPMTGVLKGEDWFSLHPHCSKTLFCGKAI